MGLYDKPESLKPLHWFWILGLAVLYALYTGFSWSTGYIDFGDGNYMYISWRIAQGAVVYRDILAPQPPCHLFLGAGLIKLGDLILRLSQGLNAGSTVAADLLYLYIFRGFSLLLHLATYALLLRLAWRAWGRPVTTVLAGAIWLWLPIGYWWALGYQSEPLEIFFLLAMMTALLRGSFSGDLLAGLLAGLAAMTNATSWPFLVVLALYLLSHAPLRALRVLAVGSLVFGVIMGTLQIWTEGAFWQNAFGNQVGTFPHQSLGETLNYAYGKLLGQGSNVLALEGAFLILALLGFWRYLATTPLDAVSCGALGWFCLATLGSLIYVAKGGTEDYIFSLSEPAVALLAAGELAAWGRRWTTPLPEVRQGWIVRTVPFWFAKGVAALILLAFALIPGLSHHYKLRTQKAYELPDAQADRIVRQIKRASTPDQAVLAPPFYAFRAQRRLWSDYSELFIWQIMYWNDREANDPRGAGWRKARQMAQAIRDGRLPLVILELNQQGRFPELQAALRTACVPLVSPLAASRNAEEFIAPTLNTRLGFFAPRAERTAQALAEQDRQWAAFTADLTGYYGEKARQFFPVWFERPAPLPPAGETGAGAAQFTPVLKAHPAPTSPTLARREAAPTTRSASGLNPQPPALPAARVPQAGPTTQTLGPLPHGTAGGAPAATPGLNVKPPAAPALPPTPTPRPTPAVTPAPTPVPTLTPGPTPAPLDIHPALPALGRTSHTQNSQHTTRTLRRRPSYEMRPQDFQPTGSRPAEPAGSVPPADCGLRIADCGSRIIFCARALRSAGVPPAFSIADCG